MTEKQLMIPDLEKVKALQLVDRMDQMLAEAEDWDSVLNIRNGSFGVAALAGAMKMGEVAQRAKIVQLKAERKAGGWLLEQPKGEGYRGDARNAPFGDLLERLNLSSAIARTWQTMAKVPDRLFDRWLDDILKDGEEVSQRGFLRFIKPPAPKPEPEKPKSLLDRWAEKLKELSALLYEVGAYRNAKEAKLHLSYANHAATTVATMLADIKALVRDLEKAAREG